ncbi:MAG: amidase family protein, partial [Pseudomonadota bacterium]
REAGAIMLGKTNTPEFGVGSQTFNEVFGKTRNPYDQSKTCGGSSGGAAVALASGMIPIADGSDMGGSLRNPAAFCNVVGLRPTPGRVPIKPTQVPGDLLGVEGPMARRVEDVALMLDAVAGPEPDCDPCLRDRVRCHNNLSFDFSQTKIAFNADFDGIIPVDPRVSDVVNKSRSWLSDLGATLSDELPSFQDCDEVFQALRGDVFAKMGGTLLDQHRELLKDTLVWNIEFGRSLTHEELTRARTKREQFQNGFATFMSKHDYLVLPTTQVPPFDVDLPYIEEINGKTMSTYLDWMASCCFITLTERPAVSVPCGFDENGLPVGLQIVGQNGDELGVLQLAYAIQGINQHWRHIPTL